MRVDLDTIDSGITSYRSRDKLYAENKEDARQWTTLSDSILKIGQYINFIVISKHANSLYYLIADRQYRATSLGRGPWKTLLGSQAFLQRYCNKEGFNAVGDHYPHSKARIGILGNNENDCNKCDSRIGFGTGGKHDNTNACGNEARYSADKGKNKIKALGYILIQ